MHPKLAWTELLKNTLSEALGTPIVVTVRDHVDPLRKQVVLELGSPLSKGNYMPMQTIVHAYAKANDCVVFAIRKEPPRRLVLDTLIKTRLGEESKKDPFLSDKAREPNKER